MSAVLSFAFDSHTLEYSGTRPESVMQTYDSGVVQYAITLSHIDEFSHKRDDEIDNFRVL